MDTVTLGGRERCGQLRGQRCGKVSGGNRRTWDSGVQEGRLCKDCGGSDLKEEGVMDEEVKFVENREGKV